MQVPPDEYLYETLGLFRIPRRRIDLPRSKKPVFILTSRKIPASCNAR